MRLMQRHWGLALLLFCSLLLLGNRESEGRKMKYFDQVPKAVQLENAIEHDDAKGVAQAIFQGANPNTKGAYGVTPIIMAVGQLKAQAAFELLRLGADPNITDDEGDNAVTLAVRAYKEKPKLLKMVMDSGGNPNILFPDNTPVIEYFLNAREYKGARHLINSGANIDARTRAKRPLIISHGLRENWDVVWTLLQCGVKYDYPHEIFTWQDIFSAPDTTPPDSPLWPFKVKVWKFLKENKQIVPKNITALVGQKYLNYIEEKGLPQQELNPETDQ